MRSRWRCWLGTRYWEIESAGQPSMHHHPIYTTLPGILVHAVVRNVPTVYYSMIPFSPWATLLLTLFSRVNVWSLWYAVLQPETPSSLFGLCCFSILHLSHTEKPVRELLGSPGKSVPTPFFAVPSLCCRSEWVPIPLRLLCLTTPSTWTICYSASQSPVLSSQWELAQYCVCCIHFPISTQTPSGMRPNMTYASFMATLQTS